MTTQAQKAWSSASVRSVMLAGGGVLDHHAVQAGGIPWGLSGRTCRERPPVGWFRRGWKFPLPIRGSASSWSIAHCPWAVRCNRRRCRRGARRCSRRSRTRWCIRATVFQQGLVHARASSRWKTADRAGRGQFRPRRVFHGRFPGCRGRGTTRLEEGPGSSCVAGSCHRPRCRCTSTTSRSNGRPSQKLPGSLASATTSVAVLPRR